MEGAACGAFFSERIVSWYRLGHRTQAAEIMARLKWGISMRPWPKGV